ncbi:MAG: hypothetical protein ACK4SY_05490 [Pyrobaculum sp.]
MACGVAGVGHGASWLPSWASWGSPAVIISVIWGRCFIYMC